MIPRDTIPLLCLGLTLCLIVPGSSSERWSRQISNSEWIPLANPRSQHQSSPANQVPPVLQELNLPPQLRQEYQQQLLQLQKTQESIQKLLLLQQQLRSQQQLIQNQAYLPNAVENENKQAFHQGPTGHQQELTPGLLTPPQVPTETIPPVFSPQEFRQPSPLNQQRYEIDRPSKDSRQEVIGPSGTNEKPSGGDDEEIQVVYVPAETLAQRGQLKEERNREQKQSFVFPNNNNRQPYQNPLITGPEEVRPFKSELIQFPNQEQRNVDFLNAAREQELERLNEQRREIQKAAKLQAAAMQREQEKFRQREAEKKRKELAKLEEAAKQRELERIREARERQRLQDLEREKERAAKARQTEIERLAALERQKKLELEKLARKEAERARELAEKKEKEASESIQQEYVGNQFHQQHLTEISKPKSRLRPKPRPRPQQLQKAVDEHNSRNQDATTSAPVPNQPPLAVFMETEDLVAQEVKVVDVLRVLRDVKSIAVLDQLTPGSPKVFVGPANLEVPRAYAKFDLPYLSSLDTNRVERRVDKLPFFVAPLSFKPPQGYAKIPFPAPHIGSVIVNTMEGPSGPNGPINKPNPRPLIEPNSFLSPSNQGSTFQSTFESPTTPSYSSFSQDHVTPQYQTTSDFSSTLGDRFSYRPSQQYQPPVHHLEGPEGQSFTPYQEQGSTPRPHRPEYSEEATYPGPVTPGIKYKKPGVVSSFGFEGDVVSTTPVYQDSYVHTRVQPNSQQDLTSQLAQINQHDYSQHRHANNPNQHPSVQSGGSQFHQHHFSSESTESGSYEHQGRTASPIQYSLSPELPPIHPQLPGLINSLVEKQERVPSTTTTTTTEAPTTTTTEVPTTYRVRTRQRTRPTRPPHTTTTTTTPSAREPTRTYPERTRRPINRSRSRHTTTTTEDYRETYEPTKNRAPETSTRYTISESTHSRRVPAKTHKNRGRPYESSTDNQIQNTQAHETAADEGHSSINQQNIQLSSESPEAAYTPEVDYTRVSNYPHPAPSHREQRPLADDTGIPQQSYQSYQQPGLGYQASLIDQSNQYHSNYPVTNEESTPLRPTPPSDYYYPLKSESVESAPGPSASPSTDPPVYTQILEYAAGSRPVVTSQGAVSGEYDQPQYSGERNSGSVEDGPVYSYEASQEPVELTTEPITTTTTTTTTESAPQIIRQRVRGRLSSRTRPDSAIQTSPKDGEDFVQFSAVNKQNRPRPRDQTRARVKNRPHHHQTSVVSEGEGFVRIQSSNRQNYPKTIIQAAKSTTTTTIAPLTTTEETNTHSNDNEYGFIRQPNFNQPHHQISSKFRAPESQAQLQSITPTDETAEDSSPTLTQIPKHRQKYQSPNRPRPAIKSTASSVITTTPSLEGFTNKPKVRAEEPKNRIRTRVRRPGARRRPTTTTTSASIEEVEDGNDLPSDENYPRVPIHRNEQFYDRSYETIQRPQDNADSRADYAGENYPQEFLLSLGANSGAEEQQDDNPHTHQGHHRQSTSRLRAYSHQQPERDIYGAESQWSTKLSKSSFQPSLNQLNQDGDKNNQDKESQEVLEGAPEIITAQPEDAFVTVLVSSDNKLNDTKSQEIDGSTVDYGQKMEAEGTTASVEVTDGTTQTPVRRTGVRRRRVRIRVRPAGSNEDFVTAESQHINSAVNSLVQDQAKPQRSTPRLTTTTESNDPTTLPPTTTTSPTTLPTTDPVTTITTTPRPSVNSWIDSEDSPPTINYDDTSDTTTLPPDASPSTEEHQLSNSATESPTTIESKTETEESQTDLPLMVTMEVPRKSWDSTNGYTEWFKQKQKSYFPPRTEEAVELSSDEDKSHPKNHRSEWSEVRLPGDRNLYGFGRDFQTASTQVPGIVTKSVGDSSVKALSDYVQAIFDTMKSAEDEKAIVDNGSNLWKDDQKPTPSTETYNLPTDLSTIMDIRRLENEEVEGTTDFPTTLAPSTTPEMTTVLINANKTEEMKTSDPVLKSKLGTILRTSTTTRVSHMTEICYRGRCVMTKPKKDSSETR